MIISEKRSVIILKIGEMISAKPKTGRDISLNISLRAVILSLTALLCITLVQAAPLQLRAGNITLTSDKGDSTLLRQAIQLIRSEQGVYPSKFDLMLEQPFQVRFYYDPTAAAPRLHAVPYWSGGIARAGSEIDIYGRNRSQWLSTLKHELFHTLVAQNQVRIPVWLNEGLAQWQAGQLEWNGFVELGTATVRKKLIPLVDLDVILSFNHKRAQLAYAQALDAVQFLVKQQGETVLPYLLRADELSFKERFKAATGESLVAFEIAWRADLEQRFWFFKISTIPGLLWALTPLIVILAWFLKRRRGRHKLEQWELEDQFREGPRYFA